MARAADFAAARSLADLVFNHPLEPVSCMFCAIVWSSLCLWFLVCQCEHRVTSNECYKGCYQAKGKANVLLKYRGQGRGGRWPPNKCYYRSMQTSYSFALSEAIGSIQCLLSQLQLICMHLNNSYSRARGSCIKLSKNY